MKPFLRKIINDAEIVADKIRQQMNDELITVNMQALFSCIQQMYRLLEEENKKPTLQAIAEWAFDESQKFKDSQK